MSRTGTTMTGGTGYGGTDVSMLIFGGDIGLLDIFSPTRGEDEPFCCVWIRFGAAMIYLSGPKKFLGPNFLFG